MGIIMPFKLSCLYSYWALTALGVEEPTASVALNTPTQQGDHQQLSVCPFLSFILCSGASLPTTDWSWRDPPYWASWPQHVCFTVHRHSRHVRDFQVLLHKIIKVANKCKIRAGYCSESFPGQSCNVVCDFGRNNVPLCQVKLQSRSYLTGIASHPANLLGSLTLQSHISNDCSTCGLWAVGSTYSQAHTVGVEIVRRVGPISSQHE